MTILIVETIIKKDYLMSLKVVILTCQVYLQCDLIFIKEKTVIFKYIKLYLMKSLSRYMTQCKQWVGEL